LKNKTQNKKFKSTSFQVIVAVVALVFLFLSFIPIILMLILSVKSNAQIYSDFWSLPTQLHWSNYNKAIGMLIPNMINTMIVVSIATFITVLLSANGGYVFAKLNFPGKNILFFAILALMMVPGVLTLTPQYTLMQTYGIYNTWWALILPWVSGGQVFGILLCRTFMQELPTEVFESARIDGCNEVKSLFKMAIPLSKPILATIVVMKMIDYYNDFIWPLMAIESNSKQVITVAIRVFQSASGAVDIGSMVAGFVFATIPLLILFSGTSRLYMEGLTSGAVKG
jgi:ABC-type glycerol-3-phosphate transport system permease component